MESLFSREKLYRYKLRMFSFCKQLTVGETCENVLFTKTKRNAVTVFLSLQTWIPGANGKCRNYFTLCNILHGSRHFAVDQLWCCICQLPYQSYTLSVQVGQTAYQRAGITNMTNHVLVETSPQRIQVRTDKRSSTVHYICSE